VTVESDALKVATALSGWFTFGDAPGQVLPNWKLAMVVLLTLFPVVMQSPAPGCGSLGTQAIIGSEEQVNWVPGKAHGAGSGSSVL
jgi:hypothetical protein